MSITTEQLEVMLAAANARADQARDVALVEAAGVANKAMCKFALATYQNDEGRMQNAASTYCADEIRVEILALRDKPAPTDFQKRVDDWIIDCFGEVIRVESIRAKQAAKPKHSPLPQHTSDKPAPALTVREAARVLLDQPYGVMSVAFDAIEKLHGEGADRIMAAALRAIAGGGDE